MCTTCPTGGCRVAMRMVDLQLPDFAFDVMKHTTLTLIHAVHQILNRQGFASVLSRGQPCNALQGASSLVPSTHSEFCSWFLCCLLDAGCEVDAIQMASFLHKQSVGRAAAANQPCNAFVKPSPAACRKAAVVDSRRVDCAAAAAVDTQVCAADASNCNRRKAIKR